MLNNQVCNKFSSQQQNIQKPIKKINNKLANTSDKVANIKCSEETCSDLIINNNVKTDFLILDHLAEKSSWYQPHISRDLAVNILSHCPVGSFIIRHSTTGPGLALTLRVARSLNGSGILHYLISVSQAGFRIKGFTKVFSSLSALVVHHSVMKENLPCRLLIGDHHDSDGDSVRSDDDFEDIDADPEYPQLVESLRRQLSVF